MTNGVNALRGFSGASDIPALCAAYPELGWLTGDVNATPEAARATGATFSEQAFGQKHAEFDRTLVGMLALKWLLENDYQSFTACQTEGRLSEKSFRELRDYCLLILPDDEAVDAMVAYMVINDLGKIKGLVAKMAEAAVVNVDHDVLLAEMLMRHPTVSPSFSRLDVLYQLAIRRGLEAKWNGGQGIQGEDIDALWEGVGKIEDFPRDLYLLHLVLDIAGARGQGIQNGSATMNEECWTGFKLLIEALDLFKAGCSAVEVRSAYLAKRGALLGADSTDPVGRVVTIVGCMTRKFDANSGDLIRKAVEGLPDTVRAILVREMSRNGVDNLGILLYYSPALFANAIKRCGSYEAGLRIGMITLARLYHQTFVACRKRPDRGVVKVMMNKVAELADQDPLKLLETEFILSAKSDDFDVITQPKPRINLAGFGQIRDLSEIPGTRIGVWGIGGGSDGLQAALLRELLVQTGKTVAFVGSVRTKKTGSQGAGGKIGEERTVENHGGEIAPGVFAITSETTGSGRFLEYLAAKDGPVFLVMDSLDGSLPNQMRSVAEAAGGVDTLILVDTGGDALYRAEASSSDQTKATPDQDLRVLQAAARLEGVRILTCEIACGVDAPDDAEAALSAADARFYPLSGEDANFVRGTYDRWFAEHRERTGSSFLGKTPLAFTAALDGGQGYVCLPIDEALVLDRRNPWHPFVFVDGKVPVGREQDPASMLGVFALMPMAVNLQGRSRRGLSE